MARHEPWPWLLEGGVDAGMLRAWGSVLVTAFDFAVFLGCDPICLVGADLSFTNGQPYCRETIYEHDWRQRVEAGAWALRSWSRM